MKRDLKKWLKSDVVKEFINLDPSIVEIECTEEDVCEDLINMCMGLDPEITGEDLIQFIWCSAQKQFLKDILDDIDDMIEKTYNGKASVKNDKARIVAEESRLKAWLYNKYKYLQRKNGK